MKLELGYVVKSLAGRDAGRLFVVIGTDLDFAILADGRLRRTEKPKRKKLRHLEFVFEPNSRYADKLRSEGKATNSEIRRMLSEYLHPGSSENPEQSRSLELRKSGG